MRVVVVDTKFKKHLMTYLCLINVATVVIELRVKAIQIFHKILKFCTYNHLKYTNGPVFIS